KVLYLVGEVPFFERPDCEYVIAQDIYHPPFAVDAFLPAASFAEAGGTLTNVEGRVQELAQIEDLPDSAVTGFSRPDWQIFTRLAAKLKCADFKYTSAGAVLKDISKNVPGFPARPDRKPRQLAPKTKLAIEQRETRSAGTGSYLLVAQPGGFGHRGIDLSSKVEGLGELDLEEGFRLNPADLRALRVKPGDGITVSAGKLTVTGSAKADVECPEGVVYFFRPQTYGGLEHRAELAPLYELAVTPMKVNVRVARESRPRARAKRASAATR
ncbi:MAG: molybdopterin-dependent oxidoreductase, partial [Planctomycetes bacterium]|nr:molybdopterin-dependent oxidoreductase [Planctomycetota bacterium]